MNLNEKLLNLRKKNGLSQEELANKLGVTRQTISKWELGETSPDISQAKELAKIYGVSLDDLTGNDLSKTNKNKTSNAEFLADIILYIVKVSIIYFVVCLLLQIILSIIL